MTSQSDRVSELFTDAQSLYGDALEMLDFGKLRDAAEKAWGASERATGAMVLARTGQEPQSAGDAGRDLLRLSNDGPAFVAFQGQYSTRALLLHINCAYDGNCEPEPEMEALIRATNSYIQEARYLASAV